MVNNENFVLLFIKKEKLNYIIKFIILLLIKKLN